MVPVIPNMVARSIAALLAVFVIAGCSGQRTVLTGLQQRGGVGKESTAGVQVWFCKAKADSLDLVPAKRPVAAGDKLEYSVKQLLAGPTPEEQQIGVTSEIPKGTILIGVKDMGDGSVDLNLSRRFGSGGGSNSFETRMDQLTRTVADSAGGRKVYLSVEGERLVMTGEGLEIKQPLN